MALINTASVEYVCIKKNICVNYKSNNFDDIVIMESHMINAIYIYHLCLQFVAK